MPSAFLTPDEDDDAPVNDEDEPVPVLVMSSTVVGCEPERGTCEV